MTENPLAKNMKLTPNLHATLVQAPAGYLETLQPLPEGVQLSDKLEGRFDWVQIFVKNKSELKTLAPLAIAAQKAESLLWITFPKGTSNIQTDLTRDKGWETFQGADLKWINLVSVNETWSAFSLRPYKPGEEQQSFR